MIHTVSVVLSKRSPSRYLPRKKNLNLNNFYTQSVYHPNRLNKKSATLNKYQTYHVMMAGGREPAL